MVDSLPVQFALLDAAMRRIPVLAGANPSSAIRLGGLTNVNYRISNNGEEFVIRIPGIGTSEYINRKAEQVAAYSAATVGVNAEVLFFDVTDGLMLTRFVANSVTMTPDRFKDLGAVARAGHALHDLHSKASKFSGDFKLFPAIDDYRELLQRKNAPLPDGYEMMQNRIDATRTALESRRFEMVPSHCDPLCENFLDTGERMYIIDFEYSGNNDPMWDIGDLSVEGGFTEQQDKVLVGAYFGSSVTNTELGRMVAYKAMCDVLWSLWGMVQHANNNPVEDFWAYANGRFARCRELMLRPNYNEHLDNI